jgi:Putative restriction endonuclease
MRSLWLKAAAIEGGNYVHDRTHSTLEITASTALPPERGRIRAVGGGRRARRSPGRAHRWVSGQKKWDAYAHGRIAVYWIINLVHRRVEVYTDPGPAGYESCQFFTTGQEVPVVIDGVLAGRIAVADILPSTT